LESVYFFFKIVVCMLDATKLLKLLGHSGNLHIIMVQAWCKKDLEKHSLHVIMVQA